MRAFALQWSLHGVSATARAQRCYVSPSQINMGDRPKRISCLPRRFVDEFCQLREKTMEKVEGKRKTDMDLYVVEVVEVDTTRKQLKIHFVGFSHEYDEWRDYDNKRNHFSFVRLEKCFSPRKVPWKIEATIFTGNCVADWFLQCLLNYVCKSRFSGLFFGPLKWYKLKSCGNE